MTSQNLDAALAAAQLPERTVSLCLAGHLQARFEDLERQLKAAQDSPARKLTDVGPQAIAEQMEALRGEMAESTVVFTLRGLPRKQWHALVAQHPSDDPTMAYDAETLGPALVRASVIDPKVSEEQWARLDEKLTDGQWSQLTDTAWNLNRRAVDVPFSLAASQMLRTSEPK